MLRNSWIKSTTRIDSQPSLPTETTLALAQTRFSRLAYRGQYHNAVACGLAELVSGQKRTEAATHTLPELRENISLERCRWRKAGLQNRSGENARKRA